MIFLPIVQRELRVTARRAATYRMRFLAGLFAIALWLFLVLGTRSIPTALFGHHILLWMGSLALGFCALAGVFLTSDCVSAEKREGTLGLLFLTDLRAYDVVLGKLVATSVHAFFGLLAAMPVLGLTLMMGGVTGTQFVRLTLVFVVTLFFSLAAGIFISTVSQRAMRATAGTFLLVMGFAGVLPALWWAQSALFKSPVFDLLLAPSPTHLFRKAFDASYRFGSGAREFWQSLSLIAGLACACITIACVALPRVWQTRDSGGESRPQMPRWFARRPRTVAQSRAALARAANPVAGGAGRELSARMISWRVLVPLVALCAVLLIPAVAGPKNIEAFVTCFLTAYGLHVILKVLIALEASRRITEDRQSGALELLLVTTLPTAAIIQGQREALQTHFRRPMLLLSALNVAMMLAVLIFPKPLRMGLEEQAAFSELFMGGIIVLFLDYHALGWLGIWKALNTTAHRAVAGALILVMGGPWVAIFLLFALQPNFSRNEMLLAFAFFFVAGAVIDIGIIRATRRKLATHFRAAAAGAPPNLNPNLNPTSHSS